MSVFLFTHPTRTRVIGYELTLIQDDYIVISVITYAKALFPNKVTTLRFQLDMGFFGGGEGTLLNQGHVQIIMNSETLYTEWVCSMLETQTYVHNSEGKWKNHTDWK